MTWLSGYLYRKAITLTGGSSGAQTYYQLKLAAAFVTDHMQTDFDDLRFTDADGNLIDAWLEEKTDGTSADVWVEFPTTPVNGDIQTYYMYYGKADAVNYWDIVATFLFGEDFEYTDDPSNHGWTDYTGNAQTSVDQAKYGIRSLLLDASSDDRINRDDVPSGAIVIEFNYYDPFTSSSGQQLFYFTGTLNSPSVNMAVGHNGYGDLSDTLYCYYLGGTYHESAISKTVGWHHVKLVYDGSNSSLYFDDNTFFSNEAYTPNLFYLYVSNAAQEDWYADALRVRKYAANPPTYAFGSEENAPTGLTILDFERPTMRGAFRGIMRGTI